MVLLVAIFGKRLLDVDRGADPRVIPSVLLNTPMPKFSLAALPGRKSSAATPFTDADLKGRVSLVNVFGSWCIACLEEHPTLVAIAKQGGVQIYGIDWRDTPERGAEWLNDHGDPYALIGQDPDSTTAIDLGVTGAPETFVVDGDGIIRYKQIGPITPEIWQSTLRPLIADLQKTASQNTDGQK
ncbi:MAG: DsbE family thiol:disulfide interchange protein [Rhodospirillaceae bacterium]|nr:MAG: DsbE family thiol:disulfide interchange protein [Rhodospirillaceae bacterium]